MEEQCSRRNGALSATAALGVEGPISRRRETELVQWKGGHD